MAGPWENDPIVQSAPATPWANDPMVQAAPLAIRTHPVDDPKLPSVSEYGDLGGASWNQPAPPASSSPATPSSTLPIFPKPETAGTPILDAAGEGWRNAPKIIPQEQIDKANQYPLGYWITSPLMQMVNAPLQAGNALFRGGQQTVQEALTPLIGSTGGRDIAAIPEAFPFGFGETGGFKPAAPETAQDARNALGRRITVEDITDAIKRSPDIKAEVQQNILMPGEAAPPSGPVPQQTTAQEQPPPPQPSPGFVPPGSPVARVRPAEIPPSGAPSVNEQGVATPIQPPPSRLAAGATQAGAQPTHIYQGPEYDHPVTPTGVEYTHADGRVYAQVHSPDGSSSIVPKDQLAPNGAVQGGPQPVAAAAAPGAPSSPGIAQAFGQMGGAIGDNLRDYLWSQLQKGDLTEAGGPSTLLQTAKYNVDNGAIKNRADFDRFIEDYGNRQAAQRAAQQPGPQPTPATAAAAPADDSAWVGSTAGQVHDLVQQNAAQGGPASLNAAVTPEQLAAMSPQMAKSYRRMAEVNRVVSPIEGEDTSIKVPGSVPTQAEAMGNPATSQQEVLVRQRKPEAYEGPQGRLTQNNAARLKLFDEMTPSSPQIQTLAEDQAKQAKADTALVNRNAGPVDGTPVAGKLKQILADPRIMEQPDVVKVLQPIHDALYDAGGNLKTDIQSYWGMHDNLMNKLAKAKDPLQASSSEKFAFNQLTDAKTAIDDAMSKASNGAFQTFLDNQRAFFQQRNAATILRDFREKAGSVDPKTGYINPNAFHRFVTDLAVRRGQPGIDAAMDIPDAVFGKLMDIDDDLKRAGRIDLGKPRGSATNLFFELANGLGIVGAHSLVHAMGGGPFANVVLQRGIEGLQSRMASARLNSLVRQSLNYPPEGPPPNPNPPGQFVPPALRQNPLMPPSP